MEEIQVLVEQKNGVVDFNFEQIKEQLTKEMDIYSSLVFTEDQKALAKKDIANLRKLKTAIDGKRKEVKKTFLEPYNEFESKVKELISLIDEPIALIDKQVAEFEAKQKAEKQEKIKEIYAELIDGIDYIPLASIYKKEWENASTSLKSIKADMEEKIFHINQDLQTLDAFGSDACEKAKATYLSNGYNLGPCVQYIQQYEQQKKEIEARQEQERIRKEEEAKRAEEERIRKEQEEKIKEEMQFAEEQRKQEVKQITQEEPEQGGFNFTEEPQGFSFPTMRNITIKFSVEEDCMEDTFKMLKNILGSYEVIENEV